MFSEATSIQWCELGPVMQRVPNRILRNLPSHPMYCEPNV